MTRLVAIPILVLIMMFATVLRAQQLPGLLGITLGTKLEVPACPKGGPGVQIPTMCAEYLKAASWGGGPLADVYQVFMDVEHRPSWTGRFQIVVVNGIVKEITLYTLGNAVQTEAFEATVKRLGQPDKSQTRDWKHERWGQVKSVSASWQSSGWQASFEGLANQLDVGLLKLSVTEQQLVRPSAPL